MGIEEGRKGVQALGLDHLGALGVGLAGRGQLGDLAVADDEVVNPVDPRHRIEDGRPPQDQVRVLAGTHVECVGQAHAGVPIGVGRLPSPWSAALPPSPPASSS